MENKQIIIDGVDVSGCTYSKIGIDKKNYCEQDLYDDGTPVFTCDECTNCYYKQLKRKEQECEELHSRTASIIYCLTGGRLSYSTYTLESCEDAYQDQLSIDVERATKELEEENNKLKTTLTEIKAIAEEQVPYLNIDKTKTMIEIEYDYAGKIYNLQQRMYKILQKISEVLKDE